jgi:hypothetical protein
MGSCPGVRRGSSKETSKGDAAAGWHLKASQQCSAAAEARAVQLLDMISTPKFTSPPR